MDSLIGSSEEFHAHPEVRPVQRTARTCGSLLIVFLLSTFAGCEAPAPSKPPPIIPNNVQPPRPYVRKPPIYPPIQPLPPRPMVAQPPKPQPAPPANTKPVAPPTSNFGTLVTAAQIRPGRGIDRKWQTIVVHHSATRLASPQSMDKYHREHNHWKNGLGYHFVIGNGVNYPDGKVFVGPRWKQQAEGAHCRTRDAGRYFGVFRPKNFFNTNGIGICLIGNLDKEAPTPRQLAALEQLIVLLCDGAKISPDRVYGHGEVTNKTACPGDRLSVRQVRQRVAASFKRAERFAFAEPLALEWADEFESNSAADCELLCLDQSRDGEGPTLESAEDELLTATALLDEAYAFGHLELPAFDGDACDDECDAINDVIYASPGVGVKEVCGIKPGSK